MAEALAEVMMEVLSQRATDFRADFPYSDLFWKTFLKNGAALLKRPAVLLKRPGRLVKRPACAYGTGGGF